MPDTHAGVDITIEMGPDKNLLCLGQMYTQRGRRAAFQSDSHDGGHGSGVITLSATGPMVSYSSSLASVSVVCEMWLD